jgi:hypothetical protein
MDRHDELEMRSLLDTVQRTHNLHTVSDYITNASSLFSLVCGIFSGKKSPATSEHIKVTFFDVIL